jgi:hypothetical protein
VRVGKKKGGLYSSAEALSKNKTEEARTKDLEAKAQQFPGFHLLRYNFDLSAKEVN